MENIYKKADKKVEKIIKLVSGYMKNLNVEYIRSEINKAYIYARDAHEGQTRLSGDPYIIHPVEATYILLELKPDIYTIQSCLLHDVIEDTPKTKEDISKAFWEEVWFLCEGLAKLSKVRYKWQERDIWSLRKMFVAMAEDLRVVFIKLSDRLHNMKTLKYHPNPEKRKKIALETLNIYSPIADRLWLFTFKNALDIECFKILDPKSYKRVYRQMKEIKEERDTFIKSSEKQIDELLKWTIENYEIDYRVKSIYSIYKKLEKKWLTHISELFDVFGIRIMVNTEADCYKVLWIIHNKWTPLPKRFKDYIALPKPNWYRSLHTSVMWLFWKNRKQPTEIQIKTFKMKEYADIWVAAHFEYKEKWSKISKDIDWVKDLKDMVDSLQDSDFVGSLKVDVFKDRIYVFTPQWDFINLPVWSTPIDFAYSVHSELGDHISISKVNNQVYPLDKELSNWDVVEIITDKNKKPNPFRVYFVKTVKAKNRIKSFLKKENKELHIERWREIVCKYMEKFWLWKLDKDLTILKNVDWKILTVEERNSVLESIWNFSLPVWSFFKKVLSRSNPRFKKEKQVEKKASTKTKKSTKKKLIIWWEDWLKYKLCYCCRRKLPSDIVAHINNKWEITIHKITCKVLKDVNKDRLLSAYLDSEKEENLAFNLKLIVSNKIWVMKKITDVIYSMWINIDSINTKKIWNLKTEINLELRIDYMDYLLLDRVVYRIKITLKKALLDYNVSIKK